MSNTDIRISEANIKSVARTIRDLTRENASPSYMQVLQSVCQGLWGKSYEEARATLMSSRTNRSGTEDGQKNDAFAPAPAVHLLHYGSETILTVNGRYICGAFPGTDLECPVEILESEADLLAQAHGSGWRDIELPKLLDGEFETEDIIELARRLGYFRYWAPLFEILTQRGATGVLIDDGVVYGAHPMRDADFELGFRDHVYEQGSDWREVMEGYVAVHWDFPDHGDLMPEIMLTLDDLGRAGDDGHNWVVGRDQDACRVQILT